MNDNNVRELIKKIESLTQSVAIGRSQDDFLDHNDLKLLVTENDRLTSDLRAVNEKVERLRKALEHYAAVGNWSRPRDRDGDLMDDPILWMGRGTGCDIAAEALNTTETEDR